MRLIIVRHGETDSNTSQILQGHLNNELNERGKSQAFDLSFRLKNEKINHIYSSDLARARQTAEPISHILKIPIFFRKELRERNYGIYQGELINKYEEDLRLSGIPRYIFRPENGETFIEMEARVSDFIRFLKITHKEETILIVSHSGTNRILIKLLLNKDFSELSTIGQSNASITILDLETDGLVAPELLNCTNHLKSENSIFGLLSE
ncbi:MAG TPA: histidine phosphatase family protein [Oligoflexia bacterium]|nr:histidine phosphatase family protein [Oligoflexia bacterium]HMP48351.1 histidine phosphatase family protein [Oligoflexia bacterium]